MRGTRFAVCGGLLSPNGDESCEPETKSRSGAGEEGYAGSA
jgi:hypothetical protein